jgi:hypothetical protein
MCVKEKKRNLLRTIQKHESYQSCKVPCKLDLKTTL